MHDLIPLDLALPGALTTAEIDATMAYAEAEKALATRAAYASDWRDFAAWCASRGATAPVHRSQRHVRVWEGSLRSPWQHPVRQAGQ